MRGEPGTKVSITVKRKGRTLSPVTLIRAAIHVPAIESADID